MTDVYMTSLDTVPEGKRIKRRLGYVEGCAATRKEGKHTYSTEQSCVNAEARKTMADNAVKLGGNAVIGVTLCPNSSQTGSGGNPYCATA